MRELHELDPVPVRVPDERELATAGHTGIVGRPQPVDPASVEVVAATVAVSVTGWPVTLVVGFALSVVVVPCLTVTVTAGEVLAL